MNYFSIFKPTRLLSELLSPSFYFSTLILTYIHSFRISLCQLLSFSSHKKYQSVPLVVWDIRSSPITFDFVWFLFHFANLVFRDGFHSFDLLIYVDQKKSDHLVPQIPGYNKYVDKNDLLSRIHVLIKPLSCMANIVSSVKVVSSKNEARQLVCSYKHVYPQSYSVDLFYPSGFDYTSCYSHLFSLPFMLR